MFYIICKDIDESYIIFYMLTAIILLSLLFPLVSVDMVMAEEGMTSHLICPCECDMVISTCDCPTSVQIKKEINSMKENGFSEKQIFSALKTEYGNDIAAQENKDTTSLWVGGVFLSIVLVILGLFMKRKLNPHVLPFYDKYQQRFEEEYRRFVDETEEK